MMCSKFQCGNEPESRMLLLSDQNNFSFIIVGASGDLAKKQIYPSLWNLFCDELLPSKFRIFGYARSKLTIEDIKERCREYMKVNLREEEIFERYWKINYYISGQYNVQSDFEVLDKQLKEHEDHLLDNNRLFYLAVPPSVFQDVIAMVHKCCVDQKGWSRIIVEKPFGKDSLSAQVLNDYLTSNFKEDQIYRMDHYLGKEMVQNLIYLRFGNKIFSQVWNRENIASVQINFKENMGIRGRAGYFDEFGILRDVMQNHLIQILTLVALEKPFSRAANDIRDEKVKVLKHIPALELKDIVLGQYIGDPLGEGEAKRGYLDEPGVPQDSLTATSATAVLRINNERWQGVPFILQCGKGLDENKAEIRIEFQDVPGDIFNGQSKRNELVVRVQPGEAIYIKLMVKKPGLTSSLEETELDLRFAHKFSSTKLPGAYHRLIIDIITGFRAYFVHSDELVEAWRIFTPLLNKIESEKIKPIPYKFGSKGPEEAEKLIKSFADGLC